MILIIDNGSQYTHLIKRNCRDLGFESNTINARADEKELEKQLGGNVEKIILSGGPGSVYSDPPNLSSLICTKIKNSKLDLPLLGICYGHQMIAHVFGATVSRGKSAEYGLGKITIDEEDEIFRGVPKNITAWVSHFDEVKKIPEGFAPLAHSEICSVEAMKHTARPIFCVQFHPEVWHTESGEKIIENFLKI